jgi:hypothetical protein
MCANKLPGPAVLWRAGGVVELGWSATLIVAAAGTEPQAVQEVLGTVLCTAV